jgi:hypothetical protein
MSARRLICISIRNSENGRLRTLASSTSFRCLADAGHSFSFAGETVSNTIPCEAHMARGIAMTTDICGQPGDGAGYRSHAGTHVNAVDNDLLACGGELQVSFEG